MTAFDVVIPTAGRPSLDALLSGLGGCRGPRPGRVVIVDDRARPQARLLGMRPAGWVDAVLAVVRGPARGPAAARNAGWRACRARWIAFLDDDVVLDAGWTEALAADLAALDDDVAGSQGRVVVPLPAGRRPTDWERNVGGLERARWATADMALRRGALEAIGGFDERFPRAYREDSDLGLRLARTGWRIAAGRRCVEHPARPAGPWVSLRLQAGNADDALMRALHGPGWRAAAGAPPGRLARHVAVAAAGIVAVGAAAVTAGSGSMRGEDAVPGRGPRTFAGRMALLAGAGWLAGSAELAWARIAPGPRSAREVATMLATSVAMPFVATGHRLRGEIRVRTTHHSSPAGRPSPQRPSTSWSPGPRTRHSTGVGRPSPPAAVLLDRDGTLVVDVPYNGDPDAVVTLRGARLALDRLRAAGVGLALISNQSGIARGLITAEQVEAVNARLEELLGPLGPWLVCPHGPGDGCACRKPAPGLVHEAAARLGVGAAACVVIGDIGADVEAAAAAGARAILVPTAITRDEEVLGARERAPDLEAAVDLLLGASALTSAAPAAPRLEVAA